MEFSSFATEARAAFDSLHIDVMMYEKASALGIAETRYRLRAEGMKIGPDPLIAEATSGQRCIAALVRLVAQARQQHRQQNTPSPLPLAA